MEGAQVWKSSLSWLIKCQNSFITYSLFVTWFSKLDCEGGVVTYLYYTNNFLHMIEKEVRREEHDISSTQMDGEE